MDCPKCKAKLQISKSYPSIENDYTPDKPTRLFECQELCCLNDKCEGFGIVKDTIRHEREL